MAFAVTAMIGVRGRAGGSLARADLAPSARSRPSAACACRRARRRSGPAATATSASYAVDRGIHRQTQQTELTYQDLAVHRMVVHHQHAAARRADAQAAPAANRRPAPARPAGAARSRSVTVNAEPMPGLLLHRHVAVHQLRAAAARSTGRGRCRRTAAWSSCRPGRTAGTAAPAPPALMPMPVSVTVSVDMHADHRRAARSPR